MVRWMAESQSNDLVARWRDGDQAAAAELFGRYADRLIALARSRLSAKVAGRVDPEDVVQSAYRSFFAGTREGRYDLQRGGDVWRLLLSITLHKLYRQVQQHQTQKRAVDREHRLSDNPSLLDLHAHMQANAPSLVEAVALADELEQAMRGMDSLHRDVLELRLQGYTLEEIGQRTDRTERTVRRVLDRIKQQFEQWYSESSQR